MNKENYEEAMINAETAFFNQNYELAFEWLKKALEEDPDDLTALSRAGKVCIPLDKFDESLKYFKRAKELQSENGDNSFNLGNAYFFKGNYARALELYSEADDLGCSDEVKPKLYYQMALLCSMRKDAKSALVNFEKYEAADKTGLAAIDPDVISEKIKLYMMLRDYANAVKCASQWITVSPADIRGYMVCFSLLMAGKDYTMAEKIIDDAEKYAELNDDLKLSLRIERAALLISVSETDSENSVDELQKAYDILNDARMTAPENRRDELTLNIAEVYIKMEKYDEAVKIASTLIPSDSIDDYNIEHHDISADELNDADIDAMIEEDMETIDRKILDGEIDEDIGEYAEVYYDDEGKPIRFYPEGVFAGIDKEPVQIETKTVDTERKPPVMRKRSADFYDRLYFVLLTCYNISEKYDGVYKFSGMLKHSESEYYSYLGRYMEAFSMKKLSSLLGTFSDEEVNKKYTENIAFFRSRMLRNPGNNFAVIFRAKMYAEIGKFAKAEEMASLLTLDERASTMEYIGQCRKELKNM